MGLASKLAAAQNTAPGGYPGNAPYPGGPAQSAPGQGSYPGQQSQQYQAYPGGPPTSSTASSSSYPNQSPAPYQPSPQPPQYPPQSSGYSSPAPYNQYNPPPPPTRPGASPQPGYQPYQQQQQYNQSYGQPQSSYGGSQYGQSPYGQQQYQAPPPQPSYGQPQYSPQPQYGGYGPPQGQGQGQGQGYRPQSQQYGAPGGGQQYGAPPPQPAGPQQIAGYKQVLQATIQERGLQNIYPPNSPALDQIAGRAATQVDQLCQAWRVNREIGQDIVKLALYDVILYVDDSGSMAFEENGERIDDLKLILQRVAFAASLFDDDGIQVRFMNSNEQGNHIRSNAEVDALIQRIQFKGLTPMGTQLRQKVVEPLVIQPARSGALRKPVLVITITDGQPAGEPQGAVFDTIRHASNELSRNPRYGKGAIAFQFAQVGNDLKAREFLSKLDEEPGIGELIDCTSNFEVEQDEMSRANPPVDLTPELWLIKLLLGSIDSSYDTKDEKSQAHPPPGGGYGGPPPPPQYGGGQGGYPPQGQYGGPPPQQQQYGNYGGPQGYNRPPPGPPGQPPYPGGPPGYPGPPGGGYPPQPPRY